MSAAKTLSHKDHQVLAKDHRQAAKVAHLNYVNLKTAGIIRTGNSGKYKYLYKDKPVQDADTLERIRKLAIPPSWNDVWISASANGHIQATGTDLMGRKQYRYHIGWNALRNETKFHRLLEFGKSLPQLRKRINQDLADSELSEKKVLATVVELMEQTFIRVGNSGYEKLYGSYGLTTLKDKHVQVGPEKISFTFKGKKGVEHSITIKDRRLARIVRKCRDIPGKELFQYYTPDGSRRNIDSGMVNNYIKEATSHDFSAKDFRTWAGSVKALECLQVLDEPTTSTEAKKHIAGVLDQVSAKLGNTRTVCKKYYVHPVLLELYESKKLQECLKKAPAKQIPGLESGEKALMCVLDSVCK